MYWKSKPHMLILNKTEIRYTKERKDYSFFKGNIKEDRIKLLKINRFLY